MAAYLVHGLHHWLLHARDASSSSSATTTTAAASALPNLNLSNGSCYASPHSPMDRRFIPCGNAAAQVQTCCWEGDICLADNACFGIHGGVYNTYMAGCTDAGDWDSSSDDAVRAACPAKPAPYAAEPWIGLAYCNGSSDQWVACPQALSPTSMQAAGPCACPTAAGQRVVAVEDGPTLGSYASLPRSSGGSIMWFPPYSPTYPATLTAVTPSPTSIESTASAASAASTTSGTEATSALQTTTSATGPTTTARATASPSSLTTNNTALVIGVSVGIGGLALLMVVGALAFFLVVRRRRRGKKTGGGQNGHKTSGDGADHNVTVDAEVANAVTANEKMPNSPTQPSVAVSELEMRPARPWSMRSELDGNGVANNGTGVRSSAGRSSVGTLLSSPMSPSLGEVMESSAVSSMQHTGNTGPLGIQWTGQSTGSGRYPGAPFETLVELEG